MPLPFVMTLIAGPGGERHLAGIAATLGAALGGASRAGPDWLAPGIACDLAIAERDSEDAGRMAARLIAAAPVDYIVQSESGRRKGLLVADMESTMIENEMLDELADFLGLRAHVADITHRTMNGEIDFETSLDARVRLLAGLDEGVLAEAARRIRPMPGGRALVATMRRHGAYTALVSGGFQVFADGVGASLGFERVIANRLVLAEGRLTGAVERPIVTREAKREALLALAAERALDEQATLAIGDGANDVPMLAAAGLGIAFHAKPAVAAEARWRIAHADLRAVLYAQGYRREEIVE